MAFADLYPLAAFAGIADASWWRANDFDRPPEGVVYTHEQRTAASKLDQADRKRLDAHRQETLMPAIHAHLIALNDQDALGAATGLAGRDVWPARAWNALVAGHESTYETSWLLDRLAHGEFTRIFVRMDDMRRRREREPGEHVPPTAEQVEAAWTAICRAFDEGTSGDQHTGWGIDCPDGTTGDRCELTFERWQARLMRRNERHDLEPALDVVALPLAAAAIQVMSGRLLLTDTLRIEGFSDGTDLGDAEYREASLNSDSGKLRRTELHAERHDMGFAQTSNTMVDVFVSDADGSIAFMPYGTRVMKGWSKHDRHISCDVWRVTAIDRDAAVRLVAAGGNTDPQAVDAYLALAGQPDVWTGKEDWEAIRQASHDQTYSRNVVRLDVAPGTWTMHCGQDFHKRVDRRALGLPRTARPWAVLQSPRLQNKALAA